MLGTLLALHLPHPESRIAQVLYSRGRVGRITGDMQAKARIPGA